MLKNQNIICISSIDWDFIWQGHQEIMSTFAKNGNRVLFIENTGVRAPLFRDLARLKKRIARWFGSVKGFRKEMDNLFVYSPLILPFPYSKIARGINRYLLLKPLKRWMKIMEFGKPIIWTFLPTGTALDIINDLDKRLLVYYCIADFNELVDNPKKLKITEEALIKKCDIIFVQGEVLKEKCRRFNNNVSVFPFGVNTKIFDDFESNAFKDLPEDLIKINKPIIGYIGGIHKHIDFNLLRFIATTHPEWSIVLIGPEQTGSHEISNLANVFLLGKKDFSELPYYINSFNVCIIPYSKSGYTITVYPTKLNEYHALGKPVVSTALPEIVNFNKENDNLVLIGNTYEEFTNCISKALNDKDSILVDKRISSARKNSWVTRIGEMSNLMEDALDKKSKLPFDWRESFLKLYKVGRRKFLRAAFVTLSAYFLIFYTPLVWFFASPLKISQAPQKADCIVVFAGGVGESGKAGQGYEERVQYAVELYKKGYAGYIIFSSGYTYIFKEPLVMKALAVSVGVPESAIFLEDKAANTYQNVKLSFEILDNMQWKTALLVSSPYHMRRVSLVVDNIAQDIKITYVPIPNSVFYSHPENVGGGWLRKQIDFKQIKGILHEYIGILYYWYKGYI